MRLFLILPLVTGLATLVGCAEGPVKPDPAVVAGFRDALLLTEEPATPITPIEWLEKSEEDDAASTEEMTTPASDAEGEASTDVVLVGQIGGMPNPWPDLEKNFPWRDGEATFFLVDPSVVAEFEDHAGEEGDDHAANCPFCAREAANKASSVVAVNFLDASGATIAIGAGELFDVAVGETVVVRGQWRSTAGDLLVIDADGLYIRR